MPGATSYARCVGSDAKFVGAGIGPAPKPSHGVQEFSQMQNVDISLVIRGIGKGRSTMSGKDEEVEGMLVQFDGVVGMIFVAWGEWKRALKLRHAMKTPMNGAANAHLAK